MIYQHGLINPVQVPRAAGRSRGYRRLGWRRSRRSMCWEGAVGEAVAPSFSTETALWKRPLLPDAAPNGEHLEFSFQVFSLVMVF